MSFLPIAKPDIDEETIRGVSEVLRGGWIASGPQVLKLEAALGSYLQGRHVRVLTSATAALEVALRAAGVGPGAEVIVPAITFAASANVILRVGATPVFVDVDLRSRNIDLEQMERAITPRTRALLPVHFAGLPVDMERLYAIASKHGLRVVEDAAHAIGSSYLGRRIGAFGDLVCFSFHPNKNMTTIEGGALVADDAEELTFIERERFHGIRRLDVELIDVVQPGGKFNMSDVSARIGLGQLARLDEFTERRRALASSYFECLHDAAGLLLPARGDVGHSWNMFAPLVDFERLRITRLELIERMGAQKIGVSVHYPALHLLECYRRFGRGEGSLPNAERIGRETVTLPMFSSMTVTDVERVCATLQQILLDHCK